MTNIKTVEGRQASLHECNLLMQRQAKHGKLAGDDLRDAIAKASYAAFRCWRHSHGEILPKWNEAALGIREDFIRDTDLVLSAQRPDWRVESLLISAVAVALAEYPLAPIVMVIEDETSPDGVRENDVHPDDVEEMVKQGWRIKPTNTKEKGLPDQGTDAGAEQTDEVTLHDADTLAMTDENGTRDSEPTESTKNEFGKQEIFAEGMGELMIPTEAGTDSVQAGVETPPNTHEAAKADEGSNPAESSEDVEKEVQVPVVEPKAKKKPAK